MQFDEVNNNINKRLLSIKKQLRESFGVDASRYLNTDTNKLKDRIKTIESKSGFSTQHKNPEWKRLKLVLEYCNLSKNSTKNKFSGYKKYKMEGADMKKHRFVTLMESELERAEIVLASRNIVDDIQDMVENLSKTKVEKLSPLVDRIKAEFGLEMAERFNESVSEQLETALESLTVVKDAIDTESLKLSGDVEPDAVSDFGKEDDLDGMDDMDSSDDDFDVPELDDSEGEDDLAGDEELGDIEPLDRELKENITVRLRTTKGKVGSKIFESKKDMRKWLNENDSKIAKILGVK